ncbi:MAG TPA: ankyrin repeat domain-containing protein, partial [Vicinamibacteria bacterium]|nr:ankyrin repeat domain-containing protein [Vicinamibacteria bacterium]
QGGSLDEQLLEAVWGGQCKSVEKLLKKGANPNARSEKVGTALMRASAICEAPVIGLLLDKGAQLEARDQHGWTALLHAVNRSRPDGIWRQHQNEAVKFLLSRKADVNVKDDDGSTALHHAARQRNPDMVKMLLAAGLQVNARNKDGQTPLFAAVAGDEVENAKALIAAGADVNARDNRDNSVMHFAMSRGDSEVLHVLHEAGARRSVTAEQQKSNDPLDRSPIDGVSLEQWARANGRMVHGVPEARVIADLKLTKARWEKVHEKWTERLSQHTLELGQEYAKAFNDAMNSEAAAAGEPGTKGDGPPLPFEKWIEVLEATFAASERVPALYELKTGDWTRVNSWWQKKLDAKQVDKALYDRLSAKYEKQFAAQPPARVGPVLRPGSLESNTEPVPLERWVEMGKAMEAGMTWTLKRQGLTLGQWIRANNWWGQKFNKALLTLDQATPAQREEAQRMHADRIRLSEVYKKKFAQGVPW